MTLARIHYERAGYKVVNVSGNESFDLLCTRGDVALRVEVKGTTGNASSVLITGGEEQHALEHFPYVSLFVVHGIKLQDKTSSAPVASGGEVRLVEPWDVRACRIEKVTLRCHLPVEALGGQLSLPLPPA